MTPSPPGTGAPHEQTPEQTQCSAKACRRDARFLVLWNNPTLHAPDREKAWVACAEHRDSLAQHLDVRGFLLRVEPLAPPTTGPEHPPTAAAPAAGQPSRRLCPTCGARFPPEQQSCPVCAGVRTGSCGGLD